MYAKKSEESVGTRMSINTVVVMGGNRGIGLGFVQYYLSHSKCFVIATYRDAERAGELKALESRYLDRIRLYQLDVTNEVAISHFAQTLKENIDILVLNAGIIRGEKGLILLVVFWKKQKSLWKLIRMLPMLF